MTLTTKQQENIVRLRAKSTKLNYELENVAVPNVILILIKEQEIVNVNIKILSYINHAGMIRSEYVAIVQPLKDKRGSLIQQNEVIIQENDAIKQVAQQQYEADREIIQQQIDDNKTELLNIIKTVNLSKTIQI